MIDEKRLAQAEAIIQLVKHENSPAGALAWAYYHKYLRPREQDLTVQT